MDLKYTEQEVLAASLDYFGGDELAASTFTSKYAVKGKTEDGRTLYAELTPDDMHRRMAKEFARIECKFRPDFFPEPEEEIFYGAMKNFKYIVPQGSPMFGIGNPYARVSISNCVVVASPQDTLSGIIETGKDLANLFKRRCGVGLDISSLRPDGSTVSNSAGTSTGAWSFAEFYSFVCRTVGQNGRRGALMITMDVQHPDIEKFVTMKRDLTKVTGANVSVLLDDEFMKAVEADSDYVLQWPCRVPVSEARYTKTIKARDLWRSINESAHASAEPGVIFWDNYKANCPANEYEKFKLVTVNPCSEIGLSEYDSCRLVSLNLKSFVVNPFTDKSYFDHEKFDEMVKLAMRTLDNIVELEIEYLTNIVNHADEEEEKEVFRKLIQAAQDGRRTGLGTHGLADALACLEIRYDSDAALKVVDIIYSQFRDTAYEASMHLAMERGAFPEFCWDKEKHNAFIKRLPKEHQRNLSKVGRRNISLLTMAPTGTVSIVSQTSSGIEPVFMNSYTRRKKINPSDTTARVDFVDPSGDRWQHFEVFHPNVTDYLETVNVEQPADLPDYFVTAEEIDPMRRVEIQSVIQKYIDHGISSTINLPEAATVEQIEKLYERAWHAGLKGVTVYRAGSRTGVLVDTKRVKTDLSEVVDAPAPKRLVSLPCNVHHVTVNGEGWTMLVGLLGDRPYEIFGGPSSNVMIPKRYKTGSIIKRKCAKANKLGRLSCYDFEAGEGDDLLKVADIAVTFSPENGDYGVITRLLSQELRHGVPVQHIVDQLAKDEDAPLYSFSKSIARVLKKYVKEGAKSGESCLTCGSKLVFEDGCFICKQCGASKCS